MELKDFHLLLRKAQVTIPPKIRKICHLLVKEFDYFNWTGFIAKMATSGRIGFGTLCCCSNTDHAVIPLVKDLWDKLVVSKRNFYYQDVWEQDNYLACCKNQEQKLLLKI